MFKSKRYAKETILPAKVRYLDNGIQRIYNFEGTGWGASVIMRKGQDGHGNKDGHLLVGAYKHREDYYSWITKTHKAIRRGEHHVLVCV